MLTVGGETVADAVYVLMIPEADMVCAFAGKHSAPMVSTDAKTALNAFLNFITFSCKSCLLLADK